MRFLLSKGTDVEAEARESDTVYRPLTMVLGWPQPSQAIQLLLDHGADIEAPCGQGITVLHEACIMGTGEVVLLLLRHGAKISSKDALGWTALHWAACKDHADTVQILLERSAEVDVKSDLGSILPYIWQSKRVAMQM